MTNRRQNHQYDNQQNSTRSIDDNYAVASSKADYWRNCTSKHSWEKTQWDETDDEDEDHWGSDVCELKVKRNHRRGSGFGKSINQSKWSFKRLLTFLVVLILAAVGCWFYPRWSRNATQRYSE